MKQFSLTILLILPFLGRAQTKIEGVGPFKIGKTTTLNLRELLAKEPNAEFIQSNKRVDLVGSYGKIRLVKLLPGTEGNIMEAIEAPYCPAIEVYFLPDYQVADVNLHNLWFTFRNDTLIRIYTQNYFQIVGAIKLKYGPGEEGTRFIESDCPRAKNSELGRKQDITLWRDDHVFAALVRGPEYDHSCRFSFTRFFVIENAEQMRQVNQCERESFLKAMVEQERKKKENLKDFE